MALINDPSRMNRTIQFGIVKSVTNTNGVSVPSFVPQFTCYCAIFKRTINQTFTVLGTDQQDNITVIIRHNINVNNTLRAILNGVQYQVIDVESDETNNIIRYDTVILKKVTKA
jgi:SPP1 family predicted phage head-tail adaptor